MIDKETMDSATRSGGKFESAFYSTEKRKTSTKSYVIIGAIGNNIIISASEMLNTHNTQRIKLNN